MGVQITFKPDKKQMNQIDSTLESLGSKSQAALKNAVNMTARQANKELKDKAKATYALKKAAPLSQGSKIYPAKNDSPVATIKYTGKQLSLTDFKVKPNKKAASAFGNVLRANAPKNLARGDLKAFVTGNINGPNKTIGVYRRKGKDRFPVKSYKSPSVPVMIGSEDKVYGTLQDKINNYLEENLQKQVDRIMGGAK